MRSNQAEAWSEVLRNVDILDSAYAWLPFIFVPFENVHILIQCDRKSPGTVTPWPSVSDRRPLPVLTRRESWPSWASNWERSRGVLRFCAGTREVSEGSQIIISENLCSTHTRTYWDINWVHTAMFSLYKLISGHDKWINRLLLLCHHLEEVLIAAAGSLMVFVGVILMYSKRCHHSQWWYWGGWDKQHLDENCHTWNVSCCSDSHSICQNHRNNSSCVDDSFFFFL